MVEKTVSEKLDEILELLKGEKAAKDVGDPLMTPILDNLKDVLVRQFLKFEREITGWMFGYRINPITKKPQFHNGIDLPDPKETPVKSPWDGVVKAVFTDDLNGNAVKLKHSGDLPVQETAYCHLHGFADGLKVGQVVKAGDVIGFLGTTGRSTGPHLHFMCRVWIDGKRTEIDPLPFLAKSVGMVEVPVHDVGD